MSSFKAVGVTALVVLLGASAAPVRADEEGEKAFKKNCSACHTVEASKNKIGPSLAGIIGRKAGTVPGFAYSEANKNSGVEWDAAKLDEYLTDPKKFMPGNKMVFAGVKKAEERKAIIAYLAQASH
jgi:cytochrome c